MAKRKPEPEYYAAVDVTEELVTMASLFMDALKWSRSTNDLGKNGDPMSTLILSLVCVSDADGNPVTADDVAFFFDLPRKTVDARLKRLIKAGSISKDGDHYRYDPKRMLTKEEEDQVTDMQRRFEKLRPMMDNLHKRRDH